MPITLYGIAKCDTVKKTKKLLESRKIDYIFFDYKKEAPTKEMLARWLTEFGAEKVINKRGTTWRKLAEETKDAINKETAVLLMLENPAIIKRPILDTGKTLELGFSESAYQQLFNL